MSDSKGKIPENQIFNEDVDKKPGKKEYMKPNLENLGDLRTLTLGGSPGSGDSGAGINTEEWPFP